MQFQEKRKMDQSNNNNNNSNQKIKIVTIGQSDVGKTSLFHRYQSGYFSQYLYGDSLTCDFMNKMVQRLWDKAGGFILLQKSYYEDSKCVTLVYEINNRQSFDKVQEYYIQTQTSQAQANTIYILIGNKSDWKEERQVQFREREEFAKSFGFLFLVTSAKNGNNVDFIYDLLLDQYLQVN